MSDKLDLQGDDQQVLARVVGYYHQTLKQTQEAIDYLTRRGITNAQAIDNFRIGYADRSLGLKLPSKQVQAGKTIRERLHQLGLFRDSGHEHFRGSITFPICAGDGTGMIVDIYGRKMQGERLRQGTAIHTHLNDQGKGVWNIEAFGGVEEVVLCPGLFDALTLWSTGYRNASCMFGADALTQDMLDAFKEFSIKRVLTPCEAVAPQLLEAGLEVFLLKLPLGLDINAYACQTRDPADALGSLLRGAEWFGKGKPTAKVVVPVTQPERPAESAVIDDQADDKPAPEPRQEPSVRVATPVPPTPQEVVAEVGEDEVAVTFGNRRYRVRGLARNAALDVLRVNLFVSNGEAMHIDTFDLYSARHRQAFGKQAAEELGVEEAVVKRDLGRLLLKLEQVQDAQAQALQQPKQPRPEMADPERDAALQLLRSPDLLGKIVEGCGVVGERTNKLVAFLAAVSRKLDQPLAILIQSTSAAGKTTLMEAVLALLPPEDVVKFSAMTGQSLYYMADDSLRHKVLAIVEEEGASRAGYALKLLQSEGELRIASTGKEVSSGRLVTQEYRVEGPVMLFLTTTSISVDEELLNRCLVLTVDEDRGQTRAIHQMQRQRQTLAGQLAARDRQDTLRLHRDAQRLLKPLLVVNPFAESLTFADTQTRTRRDHQKYLTLIRAITLLHQHQRPVRTTQHKGQPVEYIEVTLEDIELANHLATEVLGRSLDDLPPQTRRLLDLIDGMALEVCDRDGLGRAEFRFMRRQLREHTRWGNTQLKLHLKWLAELEYLVVHRDGDSKRHLYELLYQRPAGDNAKVLPGLIDIDQLRRAEWAGPTEDRPGDGRGEAGPGSGQGRGVETDASAGGDGARSRSGCRTAESVNGAV